MNAVPSQPRIDSNMQQDSRNLMKDIVSLELITQ